MLRKISSLTSGVVKPQSPSEDWGRVHLWWFRRLRQRGASVTARDVLVAIASHANKTTGEAYPTIETLAGEVGISERSVRSAIREIKDAGIVTVTARNRRLRESNLYHLAIFGVPFSGETLVPVIGDSLGEDAFPVNDSDQGNQDARSGEVKRGYQRQAPCVNPHEEPLNRIEPVARVCAREGTEEIKDDEMTILLDALLESVRLCYADEETAERERDRLAKAYPEKLFTLAHHIRYAALEQIPNPVEHAELATARGETPRFSKNSTGAAA